MRSQRRRKEEKEGEVSESHGEAIYRRSGVKIGKYSNNNNLNIK